MSKIILDDLTSIQNDPTAVDTINDNSAIIEGAFDRVLFRDGTAPNNMEADLDMNSHKILNFNIQGKSSESVNSTTIS